MEEINNKPQTYWTCNDITLWAISFDKEASKNNFIIQRWVIKKIIIYGHATIQDKIQYGFRQ